MKTAVRAAFIVFVSVGVALLVTVQAVITVKFWSVVEDAERQARVAAENAIENTERAERIRGTLGALCVATGADCPEQVVREFEDIRNRGD